MATENPRVWFKSISLENVRSFGSKQTINFTDKNGNAARWNVILGDNGTGKTTVLKGLCLVQSDFSSTIILNRQSYYLSFFRYINRNVTIEADYEGDKGDIFNYGFEINRSDRVSVWQPFWPANQTPKLFDFLEKLRLFAYGAARKIGESAITKEQSEYSANSLFDEKADLINAEEWFIQSDYISLKDKKYQKRYDAVYELINRLFREEAPGGIMIDTSTGVPQVKLCTHYGAVRLHELSLGFKTLIAWLVDFAKSLFDRYPDNRDPFAEPAVCLVDEIDLHLHPKFQRNIIQFLTETFPNTQFIVTAHSPLIVQSAEDANIILLKREGDETHVADGIDVHSWRIDQILSSDLFGGIGGRSPKIEERMARRRALLRKDERTHDEIRELEELESELNELPVMETREALKAIDIISKAVISEK